MGSCIIFRRFSVPVGHFIDVVGRDMSDDQHGVGEDPRRPSRWLVFSTWCPLIGIGVGTVTFLLTTSDPANARGSGALANFAAGFYLGLVATCMFQVVSFVSLWIGARQSPDARGLFLYSLVMNVLILIVLVLPVLEIFEVFFRK